MSALLVPLIVFIEFAHQFLAGVKKDFSGQLHKFMASLTETANQSRGQTVLYLPGARLNRVARQPFHLDHFAF